MPREREGFHEQLEALYQRFGHDQGMIPILDAAAYVPADKRTLLGDKTFPYKKIGAKYMVPLVGFARWLVST